MSRRTAVAVLVLAGLCLPVTALWAAGEDPTSSTRPPKNLKKLGDHWTPWDPPAPGPDAYIIQGGDTLWDLAGKWLSNPHLWPQIWDQNRYVLDSHWIYPGDPLVVPGKPQVVPPTGPPPITISEVPEEPAPGTSGGGAEGAAPAPRPVAPPLIPVADAVDVYCSGYIEAEHQESSLRIVGREMEREHVAEGDVVYLGQGRDHGIEPGAVYGVVRPTHSIDHPEGGEEIGTFVKRLGRIRILAVQEQTSTAVIDLSCEDIVEKDEIVPWPEIPIPRRASMPAFDRYDVTPSSDVRGYVVTSKDHLAAVGNGHLIYTDLGQQAGIRPGDVLALYRDNGTLPRLMLGQAVVLTVEGETSSAMVTLAVREVHRGDRVELEQ